ncbi:hypothetical protein JHK82_022534 [Glycine max]|nr:hypothetical protein JHK85_023027 [Glycine max]KAG5137803.1 hypothetical protein JHK82_022534 [Glycine max]
MASRKRARTEDIPSSSTAAPLSVTIGQDIQSSQTLVPMLHSLFRGQFIIMHSLQELANNRPIITMEHFLEQVAWPEAQLPLVRPNEAAPPEPTPVQVDPELADPQSLVVNPLSSPEREVVPPSPPLIIISDASSNEAAASPDSPARETANLPTSPVGGIADLSYSSSGEVVALTDSLV